MSNLSRRDVIQIGALATGSLLAGCTAGDSSVPGGHLYLVNETQDPQRIALAVTRTTDGQDSTILSGVYRVPGRTVLKFNEATPAERTYRIRTRLLEAKKEQTLSVTPEPCNQGDPNNSVDVTVRTSGADELSIITWECDEQYVKQDDLTYVDPEKHRIASATETGA